MLGNKENDYYFYINGKKMSPNILSLSIVNGEINFEKYKWKYICIYQKTRKFLENFNVLSIFTKRFMPN